MKLSRGENGSIQAAPAVAKSYAVEDNLDGTETYTFTLRQNARWSDGKTVTAHDFVYAWQRLADPATGSPHAALLDMVAGYSQAREKQDGSLLQVSAPDDFTFVVQLSYKCAYFLTDVCAASATMPHRCAPAWWRWSGAGTPFRTSGRKHWNSILEKCCKSGIYHSFQHKTIIKRRNLPWLRCIMKRTAT